MTSSPTSIDDCSAACSRMPARCGRISRKYIASADEQKHRDEETAADWSWTVVSAARIDRTCMWGIQLLTMEGKGRYMNRRAMLATSDDPFGSVTPKRREPRGASASNVPAAIAARIRAISCSVQAMLCRLTRRDAVGSPTWNRWRR